MRRRKKGGIQATARVALVLRSRSDRLAPSEASRIVSTASLLVEPVAGTAPPPRQRIAKIQPGQVAQTASIPGPPPARTRLRRSSSRHRRRPGNQSADPRRTSGPPRLAGDRRPAAGPAARQRRRRLRRRRCAGDAVVKGRATATNRRHLDDCTVPPCLGVEFCEGKNLVIGLDLVGIAGECRIRQDRCVHRSQSILKVVACLLPGQA
jgi:hypothetical protein